MVAIAFDLNFRHAAEIFSGVSDYVAEARLDWQLMPLNFGFEVRLMELAKSGQLAGAIGTFVSACQPPESWTPSMKNVTCPPERTPKTRATPSTPSPIAR